MPDDIFTFDEDQNMADAYAEQAKASAEWCAKWPNHCKTCRGWGQISYREWRPGFGGCYEDLHDICDALPADHCSRCGASGDAGMKVVDDEIEGTCRTCGWDCDDGDPS